MSSTFCLRMGYWLRRDALSSGAVSILVVVSSNHFMSSRLKEWLCVVGLALLFALVMILLYEL